MFNFLKCLFTKHDDWTLFSVSIPPRVVHLSFCLKCKRICCKIKEMNFKKFMVNTKITDVSEKSKEISSLAKNAEEAVLNTLLNNDTSYVEKINDQLKKENKNV